MSTPAKKDEHLNQYPFTFDPTDMALIATALLCLSEKSPDEFAPAHGVRCADLLAKIRTQLGNTGENLQLVCTLYEKRIRGRLALPPVDESDYPTWARDRKPR